MNLFRSEEHIGRWLGGREPGATIPVEKLSELAHAWRQLDQHLNQFTNAALTAA